MQIWLLKLLLKHAKEYLPSSGLVYLLTMRVNPMRPPKNGRASIWNGVSDTWDKAASAAVSESNGTSHAFDTTRWMDRQKSMLTSARSGASPRFTNLPILIGVSGARSVVDLGGGSGWTFELVSHSSTAAIQKYFVVEQQTSVDAFATRFIEDDRVQFFASETVFDDRLNSVDVLYSNSALQYFPDNRFLTKLMLMCTPKWVFLTTFRLQWEASFSPCSTTTGQRFRAGS